MSDIPPLPTLESRTSLAEPSIQAQVFELYKFGGTYRQIAERVGITQAEAHDLVAAEIELLTKDCLEEVQKNRVIDIRRLEDLLRGLWPKALKGDTQSIDRVLKIMERRAKLMGLDAPIRTEIDTGESLEALIVQSLANAKTETKTPS